jgi:catechol 2,3-dioxygenase-like lactoylglutathione lyase family enzyme
MPTDAAIAVRKFHASLNVTDLHRSIGFYRVLLGQPPVKQRADYAKFELDDPPLVLSLQPSSTVSGDALNHLGLRVSSTQELVEIQRRLEEAGFATDREDNVACCYARQTKFWISDPDRRLWEVYVFHEDIEERGGAVVPAATLENAFAKHVPRPIVRWEYRIPAPVPLSIPHLDNSLDEVQLEGAFNLKCAPDGLVRLVADAFRALRPGGLLRIHGLAADRPLTGPLPPLPGPAAIVERVPAITEPMQIMLGAGFVTIRFETLSQAAHFIVDDVPLREVRLLGAKPGYRPSKLTHYAVYLGPLAQVIDDFGNVFRRGERVALNIQDWQALSNSPVAAQFRFFSPPEKPVG